MAITFVDRAVFNATSFAEDSFAHFLVNLADMKSFWFREGKNTRRTVFNATHIPMSVVRTIKENRYRMSQLLGLSIEESVEADFSHVTDSSIIAALCKKGSDIRTGLMRQAN